jgi:hypothetical protein
MLTNSKTRLGFSICANVKIRLQDLDDKYQSIKNCQSQWPPISLPDGKALYTEFYNDIHDVAQNIVCCSYECIGYRKGNFHYEACDDANLELLSVDPNNVPFDFSCGIPVLDEKHIMIDRIGIVDGPNDNKQVALCSSYYRSIYIMHTLPKDDLANSR